MVMISSPETQFADTLKASRSKLGFKSQRAFYQELSKRGAIDMNYSYYARIESARTLPAPPLAKRLAQLVGTPEAEKLVVSYCRTLFPEFTHLFQSPSDAFGAKTISPAPKASPIRQQFLNPRQVHAISQSRHHYFLFLLITLSRIPIQLTELEQRPFPKEVLKRCVLDLEKANLLRVQDGKIHSLSSEMRFPSADASLKSIYLKLDEWEEKLEEEFDLKNLERKMFFRRTSERQFRLIQRALEFLFDLTRASDELKPELNDQVFLMRVRLSRGRLPG